MLDGHCISIACYVTRSHLEAAALREGGYLKIYIISNFGQATCSGFPSLGLCGV